MGYCVQQHVPAFWKHLKIAVQGPYHMSTDCQEVYGDGSIVSKQGSALAQATPMLYQCTQVNMRLLQLEETGERYLGGAGIGVAQSVEDLLLVTPD